SVAMHVVCDRPSTSRSCTVSLHDALPIYMVQAHGGSSRAVGGTVPGPRGGERSPFYAAGCCDAANGGAGVADPRRRSRRAGRSRSEEHTSELQSRENLVCRLLLEKKKKGN